LRFTTDGGRVLVSDLEGGELVVIDAGTRSVLKRIAAGKAPEGILIEPGGSRAYVAVSGDNQVAVLNVLTWEVTDRFSTGMGPDGMAWAVR
jgi:YVTN family beta-propeller protein